MAEDKSSRKPMMPGRTSHSITRRTAVSSLSLLAGAGFLPRTALAQSDATVRRFKVGECEIIVLSDGAIELPPSVMLPGRELVSIEQVFAAAGQKFSVLRSEVNVAVIKTGADTIVVDAGAGPDFMPTLGRFQQNLEAAGIKPEAVTKVLFTHAHPDHLWGVVDPLGGDTMFEKAEHFMATAEFEYWIQPDVDTRVPEAFRGMAVGTHRRLKSLAPRIKPTKPGQEIAPGIQIIDSGGHTPGHVSVLVRSGGEQLLIGSDVLTQQVISFSEPGWRWGPDMDAERAIASRRRILEQLATERIRLLGYHLPWPGLGRVERKGNAYRFVQA